jgi:hypothetical protein
MVTHPAFRAYNFIKFFWKYFDIGSEAEGGCSANEGEAGFKAGIKAEVEGRHICEGPYTIFTCVTKIKVVQSTVDTILYLMPFK